MGRIAEQTRSILPVTWDALSNDERIGDSVLAARVDFAEALIFGEELEDTAEDALGLIVVEYVAKNAALQVIDAAIDFWMTQTQTVVTTGTDETESYPDRIKALTELAKKLTAEIAVLEPIVEPQIPTVQTRNSAARPLLSTIDLEDFMTPEPRDLGPIYAPPAV